MLIAYFLSNMCAKHYENPTMLSKVTAKNVGDVFLRHTVYVCGVYAQKYGIALKPIGVRCNSVDY